MPYIPLENLLKKEDMSIFKLTLAAAARANELAEGAQPLIQSSSRKVATLALEEIAAGKVSYEEAKPKGKKSVS